MSCCFTKITNIGYLPPADAGAAFQFVFSSKTFEPGCIYTMPICVIWGTAFDGTQPVQLVDQSTATAYNVRLSACEGNGVLRLGNLRPGMRLRMIFNNDTLDGTAYFTLVHPACPLKIVAQPAAAAGAAAPLAAPTTKKGA